MKFALTKMAVAFLLGTLATSFCNGQAVENTIREYSSPNGIFSGTITRGDGVFDNTGVITGPNGYTADFQRGGGFGDGVIDRSRPTAAALDEELPWPPSVRDAQTSPARPEPMHESTQRLVPRRCSCPQVPSLAAGAST